jgi:hypothetical protein
MTMLTKDKQPTRKEAAFMKLTTTTQVSVDDWTTRMRSSDMTAATAGERGSI